MKLRPVPLPLPPRNETYIASQESFFVPGGKVGFRYSIDSLRDIDVAIRRVLSGYALQVFDAYIISDGFRIKTRYRFGVGGWSDEWIASTKRNYAPTQYLVWNLCEFLARRGSPGNVSP